MAEETKEVIDIFLNTKFKKGRHSRRLKKYEGLGEWSLFRQLLQKVKKN